MAIVPNPMSVFVMSDGLVPIALNVLLNKTVLVGVPLLLVASVLIQMTLSKEFVKYKTILQSSQNIKNEVRWSMNV